MTRLLTALPLITGLAFCAWAQTAQAADAPQLRSGSSGEELDKMIDRMACAPFANDPQADHAEAMLRLAFHVDMRSRRTTIGDAYGYLFNCGAPKSLTTTMLSAIGKIGVRASLDDMFKLTGIALETSGTLTSDLVADNQRLKRLAAEALGAWLAEVAAEVAVVAAVVVVVAAGGTMG